ncbi:MAG: TIGR02466 family protein [Alphaproteobacteria bacterium]
MAEAHPIQINVQQLFSTPVVMLRVPEAASLNAALRKLILARAEAEASNDHSNLGGWQSSWDIAEWGGPAMARLLDLARNAASRMTMRRSDGTPAGIEWAHNAWANVNRKGNANEAHTHPGSVWSAVYWVDDGGAAVNPALGGAFEVHDPRGVAPAMLAPDLVPAVPGGAAFGASELVQPTAGDLMMFPSWVSHSVRPYLGDGVRISIAINLWPAGGPRAS